MRARPYLVFFVAPVLAYLAVLFLVGIFVVEPTTLGWIGFGVAAAIGLLVGAVASYLYPRSRTNAARLHPRLGEGFKLLVVADGRCERAELCRAVQRSLAGRPGEVLVLAPVLASPLHFLTDAEEGEREDARTRLTETVLGLERLGIESHGMVGGDDPLQAIGDALASFPASEILLVARDRRSWLERDLERKARDAFGVQVSTVTLDQRVDRAVAAGARVE
jgi:hypothetical protein